MRAIHLKWSWSETAHDEFAVTISRTVQVTLLGRSQIITRNHHSVRVWMSIQVHELRFLECRSYGVVARRFVGRVPVRDGRTGNDVKRIALFRELRTVERHPGGLFPGVNLSRPAGHGHAAACNAAGIIRLTTLRKVSGWN